jgi:hypothetical protein
MNLKELYDSNRDIRESEIPKEWKDSFNKFMFGQTCLADTDENGNVKEFIYYSHDFRRWYHLNQTQIERDLKINIITNAQR